jgi:hypothetical protein
MDGQSRIALTGSPRSDFFQRRLQSLHWLAVRQRREDAVRALQADAVSQQRRNPQLCSRCFRSTGVLQDGGHETRYECSACRHTWAWTRDAASSITGPTCHTQLNEL